MFEFLKQDNTKICFKKEIILGIENFKMTRMSTNMQEFHKNTKTIIIVNIDSRIIKHDEKDHILSTSKYYSMEDYNTLLNRLRKCQ